MSDQDLLNRIEELEKENLSLKKELEKLKRLEYSDIVRGPVFLYMASFKTEVVYNLVDDLLCDIWNLEEASSFAYKDGSLNCVNWRDVPIDQENKGYTYWGSSKCGVVDPIIITEKGSIIMSVKGDNITINELNASTDHISIVSPKELAEYVCYRLLQIENEK